VYEAEEVTEISRHLTVRCSFRLLDAVTGRTLYSHDPPPYRKTDKTSPVFMFGTLVHEEELNPLDHFIGELVERAAREFVGKLVPVTMETKVKVVGKGKDGEAGVRALRSGDYESARVLLKQAIAKDPDDHENIFALGVTFELLGRPENALFCYRRRRWNRRAMSRRLQNRSPAETKPRKFSRRRRRTRKPAPTTMVSRATTSRWMTTTRPAIRCA
jgi:thioredoxin-like negative regulator of GroEL